MKTLIITLILATNVLNLEIASTRAQKERGLMWRTTWNAADGMIFINKNPSYVTYWMKNTPLKLTMYFMDENLDILEMHNPEPLSASLISSMSDKVKYVLELNPLLTNAVRENYPAFREKLKYKLLHITNLIIEDE